VTPLLTWLGQATFLLETGGARILIDPFFSEMDGRTFPPPAVEVFGAGIDRVLVTHEHIDHLDPYSLREVAARSGDLTIVAPAPLEPLVREAAPDAGFTGVERGERL
jgi:L-ascorbate 6-phosphate lactonase